MEVGMLVVLVFSPWILTTTWIMGGATRDYFWFKYGVDLLRQR
jgi:hypothetical protein